MDNKWEKLLRSKHSHQLPTDYVLTDDVDNPYCTTKKYITRLNTAGCFLKNRKKASRDQGEQTTYYI